MVGISRNWLGALLIVFTALSVLPTQNVRADDQPIRMKLATVAPEGTPWSEAMEYLKTVMRQHSDGKVLLQPFLSSTLGGELEILEGVENGSIEFGGISTGALATRLPELNALELPYLWKSAAECYYVLDHAVKPYLEEKFASQNLVFIAWSENGWQHFMSTTKPILSPADLQGMRVRSQQNQLHMKFWKTLGAIPVPLGMTEVGSALQLGGERGGVDGTANTLVLALATGWGDLIQYVTLSKHIYQPALIIANKGAYESLPENLRKVLLEEAQVALQRTREGFRRLEPQLVDTFKKMGRQVLTLTDEQQEAFRQAVQPVHDWVMTTPAKNLLLRIQASQAEFRALHEGEQPEEDAPADEAPADQE